MLHDVIILVPCPNFVFHKIIKQRFVSILFPPEGNCDWRREWGWGDHKSQQVITNSKRIKTIQTNLFFLYFSREGDFGWHRGWGGGKQKNNIILNRFFTILYILYICIFCICCIFDGRHCVGQPLTLRVGGQLLTLQRVRGALKRATNTLLDKGRHHSSSARPRWSSRRLHGGGHIQRHRESEHCING